MTLKIYANKERMLLDNWNGAYGNKILHLLFLINLAFKNNRRPVMLSGTNLDNIFKFSNKFDFVNIKQYPKNLSNFFLEIDSFYRAYFPFNLPSLANKYLEKSLGKVLINAKRNYIAESKLLSLESLPEKDGYIKGHFFEYELMPSKQIYEQFLSPKIEIIEFINNKYPTIFSAGSVAVHLRATDFDNHLRDIFKFGIALDDSYYEKAIEKMQAILGNDNIEYHLFSDDPARISKIFSNHKFVLHDDSPEIDWVAINLMTKVIQSNSSFCWTASLYNKDISIQPDCGYNYYEGTGSVPYNFQHKNSLTIKYK